MDRCPKCTTRHDRHECPVCALKMAEARIKELEARKTGDYDEILALRESGRKYARQVKELKRSIKKHEDTWDQSMLAWTNEKAKLNLRIKDIELVSTEIHKGSDAVITELKAKMKALEEMAEELEARIESLNEHITELEKAVKAVSDMYETRNKNLSDSLNRVVSLSMIYLEMLNKLGWEVRDDPEKGPTLVARS